MKRLPGVYLNIFITDEKHEARQSAISDTIVSTFHLSFADVAGLHEAKQALQEAIIMPLHYPQLFTGTHTYARPHTHTHTYPPLHMHACTHTYTHTPSHTQKRHTI